MDSRRTKLTALRLRLNRCARLEDLPDEILEKIAFYFDGETLAAFGLTNRRMQRISRTPLRLDKISIRKTTRSIFRYLDGNGSLLRRLDLSNFRSSSLDVDAIVRKCPNVTELNVINSGFDDLDALLHLKNLETLYLSALEDPEQTVSKFRDAFTSIKKLYVDIGPLYKTLLFTTTILNFCEAIEFVHLHVSGFLTSVFFYRGVPMEAARWKTLHTVIITHHLSNRYHTDSLLRDVFRYNSTPGILDWIDEDKDSYIYENGLLNGYLARHTEANEDLKYLSKVHEVWLTEDSNAESYLRSPYGSPQSIRIKGIHDFPRELIGCPSATVTELDIVGCHQNFENKFRLGLLALLPSLESFACSLCFMIHRSARDPAATDVSSQQQIFNETLQRLNLKEIRVDGLAHCECCTSSKCICSYMLASHCATCKSGSILTSCNLVDMNSFKNLQCYTLTGVNLHESAYSKMINPNVRAVRLCLNEANDFSGLPYFLHGCENLRSLKLEALDVPVSEVSIWRHLLESQSLKQLCLRLRHIRRGHPPFSDVIFDYLVQLVGKLDFIHLHCAQGVLLERLRDRLREKFGDEKVQSSLHLGFDTFDARQIMYSARERRLPNQALCYAESFVGVVKPPAWNMLE